MRVLCFPTQLFHYYASLRRFLSPFSGLRAAPPGYQIINKYDPNHALGGTGDPYKQNFNSFFLVQVIGKSMKHNVTMFAVGQHDTKTRLIK